MMRRLLFILSLLPFALQAQEVKPVMGNPHTVRTIGNVTEVEDLKGGPEKVFPVDGKTVIYRGHNTLADYIKNTR